MRETFIKKLESFIRKSKYRTAFSISDFKCFSNNYETLKKSIARLEKKGIIKRIIRGIYYLPTFNRFFKDKTTYNPYDVCLCIARKNEWVITPCGEWSANLLGVSTQVPNSYIFASSGPNVTFKIGKFTAKFKHRSLKETYNYSSVSRLVIQCLKAEGRKNISDETIKQISLRLSNSEKMRLKKESKQMMLWIQKVVDKIVKYE